MQVIKNKRSPLNGRTKESCVCFMAKTIIVRNPLGNYDLCVLTVVFMTIEQIFFFFFSFLLHFQSVIIFVLTVAKNSEFYKTVTRPYAVHNIRNKLSSRKLDLVFIFLLLYPYQMYRYINNTALSLNQETFVEKIITIIINERFNMI